MCFNDLLGQDYQIECQWCTIQREYLKRLTRVSSLKRGTTLDTCSDHNAAVETHSRLNTLTSLSSSGLVLVIFRNRSLKMHWIKSKLLSNFSFFAASLQYILSVTPLSKETVYNDLDVYIYLCGFYL